MVTAKLIEKIINLFFFLIIVKKKKKKKKKAKSKPIWKNLSKRNF